MVSPKRFIPEKAMYDRHLEAFLIAADCGSFTKAAEKMVTSPNALIKQVNLLEGKLGIQLFQRTNHGITLTEAGRSIYKDARRIIKISRQAVETAKLIASDKESIIRLGSSLMCPARPIINLWIAVYSSYPLIKLQIVPMDDSKNNKIEILASNFNDVDIIASIFPNTLWNNRCNGLTIHQIPLSIAVPINHHLANRHQITFSDLYDETIIMFENNDTTNIDEFRNTIELNHPRIHIYDVQPHDFNVFNYAANNGWPMLTIDLWDGIHPALVNIPFYSNKQYTVPYGIIYPNNPKKHIIEFISIIEQFLREY